MGTVYRQNSKISGHWQQTNHPGKIVRKTLHRMGQTVPFRKVRQT